MKLTGDLVFGFATALLSQRYDSPKPTPAFHKELWDYCCSDNQLVAVAAPRGHAKSTAVTHAYVLAASLFREADFIVIVSDTELQAVQFLTDIKMELIENDDLRDLFEIKRFLRDNDKDIVVEMGEDKHKFRIMVRGASGGSGSVRGFKWRGKRPNLIVCDDIENDEAVANQERRFKFKKWFNEALLQSLSDYGKVRVVGTILHFDSLLESLMPPTEGNLAKFTVKEGLKMWSYSKETGWYSIKYRAHTDFDDFSEILWPEKFTEERLSTIKHNFVLQGNPDGYSQEYLNYPITESSAFFRRSDLLAMEEADYDKHKNYYAAIDPAISKEDRRSYTAIVVGGVDSEGMLHIVKVIRERMDAKAIIDDMLRVQKRYSPEVFVIEKGVLERSLGPFLKDQMMKTGLWINLHPVSPDRDKVSRARSIQGRTRQGGVKFDKEAEWWPSFEQELVRFDRGEYDDQVDAFAWLGLILEKLVEAPTLEELEEIEWQEEQEAFRLSGGIDEGRSKITGY